MPPIEWRSRAVRVFVAIALALSMAGAHRLAAPQPAGALDNGSAGGRIGDGGYVPGHALGIDPCLLVERPIANDDPSAGVTWSTLEDSIVEVVAPGVLANDLCTAGITSMFYSDQVGGSVTISTAGRVLFTPWPDFVGTATALYRFTGTYGQSNSGTVNIVVVQVNDEPELFQSSGAACSSITVAEDSGAYTSACLWTGDPGPNEGFQVATGAASATNKALFASGPAFTLGSDPAGSPFTFTLAPNAHGTAQITLQVSDNGGTENGGDDLSQPRVIALTVTPVDDPPVAHNDTYSTPRGQQLVVPVGSGVLKNDTDIDGPARTASKLAGPAHGVAVLQPDGSFTYTPEAGYSGPDSFTYRATAGSLFDDATVTITVLAPGATPPPTLPPPPAGTDAPPSTPTVSPDPGSTADPSASADPAASSQASPAATAPPPPATGALPSATPGPTLGPGAAAGADLTPWLVILLIVVIVIVGLNVGLWQYLRSRRPPASPGPSSGSGSP